MSRIVTLLLDGSQLAYAVDILGAARHRKPGQQVIEQLALGHGDLIYLSSDIAVNSSHSRAQGTQCRTHAPELFGMGIAANLLHQPGRFTIVVLTQMQAALACRFYQVFTTAFQ